MINEDTPTPKLTIIVPTRERADTLIHTIKTLVVQDYQNLEILISDNFSQDNTREVVNFFSDIRIKYINTGLRLSMSDNWEFALDHATGDYITFIGDDDGFIPGSISKAMDLIVNKNLDAFVWQKIEYCWPDYIDENMRNWFSIKRFENSLQRVSSEAKLKKVMKFHEAYTKLPCLYNSIVNISKIKEIKKLSKTRKFFNSIAPDVYSGIVLSKVIDNYIYSEYPFSINGASKHSNGTSSIRQSSSVKNSPAEKFKTENTLTYDCRLLLAPSVSVCVIGEYLFAKENLPTLIFTEPNWNQYLKALIRNTRSSYFSDELIKSANHTANILKIKFNMPKNVSPTKRVTPQNGFDKDSFNFTMPKDLVSNVYDASRLVEGMLPSLINYREISPIKSYFSRLYVALLAESKNLYRSI